MTKDEIMALINKRIEDAETQSKIFVGNDSYFAGIQEGLRQAREIVGMLDKNNKISKGLCMNQTMIGKSLLTMN